MGILSWILFGLVVGVIAKLLMPGRDPGGFIVTILLGVAGALVGGFLGQAMGCRMDHVDPGRHHLAGPVSHGGAPTGLVIAGV